MVNPDGCSRIRNLIVDVYENRIREMHERGVV